MTEPLTEEEIRALFGRWLIRKDAGRLIQVNDCLCDPARPRCHGHVKVGRDDAGTEFWPPIKRGKKPS